MKIRDFHIAGRWSLVAGHSMKNWRVFDSHNFSWKFGGCGFEVKDGR